MENAMVPGLGAFNRPFVIELPRLRDDDVFDLLVSPLVNGAPDRERALEAGYAFGKTDVKS